MWEACLHDEQKRKEDKTMEFLPNPKQMEYHTGHFLPGSQTKIVLCGTEPGAFLYAQMLQKELKEEAGLSLDILRALCPGGERRYRPVPGSEARKRSLSAG